MFSFVVVFYCSLDLPFFNVSSSLISSLCPISLQILCLVTTLWPLAGSCHALSDTQKQTKKKESSCLLHSLRNVLDPTSRMCASEGKEITSKQTQPKMSPNYASSNSTMSDSLSSENSQQVLRHGASDRSTVNAATSPHLGSRSAFNEGLDIVRYVVYY